MFKTVHLFTIMVRCKILGSERFESRLIELGIAQHHDDMSSSSICMSARFLQTNDVILSLETEKYAHVTFFFNGGVEKQFELEDRQLVPSPKVATYDLLPEMNAAGVADEVCLLFDYLIMPLRNINQN